MDRAHIGLDYNGYVRPIIEDLRNSKENSYRCCGWQFRLVTPAHAVDLGLSDERVARISNLVSCTGLVPQNLQISIKNHQTHQISTPPDSIDPILDTLINFN
jgi:hypothetical protein